MGTLPPGTTLEAVGRDLYSNADYTTNCLTEFHVTGFSTFHNVRVNPTQLVAEALPDFIRERPLKPRAILASSRVLEVSAESTKKELYAMYKGLEVPSHPVLVGKSRADRRIIFVHLGVNVCVSRFYLEMQGKNEATFSCADEMGWKPVKAPIDSKNQNLSASCQTTLKLDPLITDLRSKGYGVDISTDAGRFVCNWVYYNSLQLAETAEAQALFVHVPPASVVPIKRQLEFVSALLDSIATLN